MADRGRGKGKAKLGRGRGGAPDTNGRNTPERGRGETRGGDNGRNTLERGRGETRGGDNGRNTPERGREQARGGDNGRNTPERGRGETRGGDRGRGQSKQKRGSQSETASSSGQQNENTIEMISSRSEQLKTDNGMDVSFFYFWKTLELHSNNLKVFGIKKLFITALVDKSTTSVISHLMRNLTLFEAILEKMRGFVNTSRVGRDLEFIRLVLPMVMLFAKPEFSDSLHRREVSTIYTCLVELKDDSGQSFLTWLLQCLANVVRIPGLLQRVSMGTPNEIEMVPENWNDVVLPFYHLFHCVFTLLTTARTRPDTRNWIQILERIEQVSVALPGVNVSEMSRYMNSIRGAIPQLHVPAVERQHAQASSSNASTSSASPSIIEGPGMLREAGPRHSNDKEDFRKIQILPQRDELVCTLFEYLPRKNDSHLPIGVEGYLSRIFRLFREDMVQLLRASTLFFLDKVAPLYPNINRRHRDPNQGINLLIFTECALEGPSPSLNSFVRLRFSFPQPWLPNSKQYSTQRKREEYWNGNNEAKQYWQEGSIVFIYSPNSNPKKGSEENNNSLQLGVVCDRRVEDLAFSETRGGLLLDLIPIASVLSLDDPDAIQTLFPHSLRPIVFPPTSPTASHPYVLFQVRGHFFRGYEPILRALQQHQSATFPFADLIVEQQSSAPSFHAPPSFIIPNQTVLNLSFLVLERSEARSLELHTTAKQILSNVVITEPETLFATLSQFLPVMCLDHSQLLSLVHALTHKLCLINGPPGTGKSYLGVRIVRTLLHNISRFSPQTPIRNVRGFNQAHLANYSVSSLLPIVCLCYTNHALDQFLQDLVNAGVSETDLVRVGSRSKNELMQTRNLIALTREVRIDRHLYQEEKKLQQKCTNIEGRGREI